MGVLIDASILIGVERGHLDITHRIKGREQEEFFISVITVSELLHGVWRVKDAKIKTKRSAFVEAILERFPILPIDVTTARTHAQLWADLEEKGTPIGPHDSWIAAACISHGHVLATHNIEEFKRIPGLTVEKW
jgi:predicted nucleic acid-binding protein